MDDREMVAAIRARDYRGLEGVYDAYAARLYGYCWSLLRDREAAADVLQDTFILIDSRIDQLRDPDRLRPWLYAIARHECQRVIRARGRTAALEEAGEVIDETVDLEAGVHERELRMLVWSAAEGLNPGEREVLELNVKHGLEGHDLAAALGVPANQAHALLSRARDQMECSLTALILARNGTEDCAALAALVGDWDGRLTPLLRKRVSRHAESCDTCGERKRRDVRAPALLVLLPLVALPEELVRRVADAVSDPELVSYRENVVAEAGPVDDDGFPVEEQEKRRRPKGLILAGSAVVLLIVGIVVTMVVVVPAMRTTGRPVGLSIVTPTTTPPAVTASPSPPSTEPPTTTTPAPTTTTTPPARTTTRPPPPVVPPPVTTTTTQPAPPPPGTLGVAPTQVFLDATGAGSTTVSSTGGALDWIAQDATPSVGVTISPAAGHLEDGQKTVVNFQVTGSSNAQVTFTAGAQHVTVTLIWQVIG